MRTRKAGTDPAAGVAHGEATRVVEVQVRGQHDLDVFNRQARLGERVIQVARAIEAVDVAELLVFFVARTSIDDHRPGAADDERPHGEQDPVALVGRSLGRPQRLRHDTEHRAAVEAEEAVVHRDQLQVTQCVARTADVRLPPGSVEEAGRYERRRGCCFSSTSTP